MTTLYVLGSIIEVAWYIAKGVAVLIAIGIAAGALSAELRPKRRVRTWR